MIDFDDYKRADGAIDWDAYRRARVAAGETCRTCGGYIVFGSNGPRECSDCQELATSSRDVSHDSRIRCPKCRHTKNVSDGELYEIYEDGDHDVSCDECGHDFLVSTSVSYTFRSPELIESSESE